MAAPSRYLNWLSRTLAVPGETVAVPKGSPRAVLGYATGYGADDLMPFVRSLRACFDGEIVLTVDDRPDIRDLFARYGVTAGQRPPSGNWTPHPVMERFAAYDAWLSARPWVTDVLMTDVRDVVFQSDPFARPSQGLEVFVECEGATLAEHSFDRKYLTALFGPAVTARIADKPCLCVGTVFGPATDASRLCKAILLLAAIPRSEIGGIFGADQAACNLAVHLGLIAAEVRPNYGRVATIGDRSAPRLRPDGLIENPDGSLSPVVHQYDRHQVLADAVRERWGTADHCVVKRRRKSLSQRLNRLAVSVSRRLPELR